MITKDTTKFDLESLKELFKHKKYEVGLYFLYSKDNFLLYIGKSKRLEQRLIQHCKGDRGTTIEFKKHVDKVVCYFIQDDNIETNLYLYENFAINKYKPAFNIGSVKDYTPLSRKKAIKLDSDELVDHLREFREDNGLPFLTNEDVISDLSNKNKILNKNITEQGEIYMEDTILFNDFADILSKKQISVIALKQAIKFIECHYGNKENKLFIMSELNDILDTFSENLVTHQ